MAVMTGQPHHHRQQGGGTGIPILHSRPWYFTIKHAKGVNL